jgi:hypothetical protein
MPTQPPDRARTYPAERLTEMKELERTEDK